MLGFIQMRHVVLVYRSIVIRVGYELDYRFEVDSERNLDQLGDSTLFVIAEIGCIFNLEGILVNHSNGPRLTPIDLVWVRRRCGVSSITVCAGVLVDACWRV